MKITIEYEASWRNSFLDPNTSNNEPLPKNGRKFIGSMTNLKNVDNYISRQVSIDTVMGVLNRLIGDQRKLYQARSNQNYYFRDLEKVVSYQDTPKFISNEITYIRNISGSTDQNSYTGMVRTNDPIFSSDYSDEFWSILEFDLERLCSFIVADNKPDSRIELNPLAIIGRLEDLNKLKAIPKEGPVEAAHATLTSHFAKFNGINNKGLVMPISLYCSALYLQMDRLSNRYDLTSARAKSGGISGISNNGFTKKDFMSKYSTGDKKRIWGNPYMRENYLKGEGKTKQLLTKASGKLDIELNIPREKALQLQQDIENAGVSSFYLGKKGLAYVSDIRV